MSLNKVHSMPEAALAGVLRDDMTIMSGGFGVCVNPSYLWEGTSVLDFFDPPKRVVGSTNPRNAATMMELYESIMGSR